MTSHERHTHFYETQNTRNDILLFAIRQNGAIPTHTTYNKKKTSEHLYRHSCNLMLTLTLITNLMQYFAFISGSPFGNRC